MTERQHDGDGSPVVCRTCTVEATVAGVIFALGLLVIYDSHRVGAGWASDGPQAGYFPFYIGIILCIASAWLLVSALRSGNPARSASFVSRRQLRPVLAVFLPSVGFVLTIYLLGLYVSAALYLALFMKWQGRFPLHTILPVSIAVPVALFLMFELWFLVPLPKGPLEAWLGY